MAMVTALLMEMAMFGIPLQVESLTILDAHMQ
jgi:hypothetical protein